MLYNMQTVMTQSATSTSSSASSASATSATSEASSASSASATSEASSGHLATLYHHLLFHYLYLRGNNSGLSQIGLAHTIVIRF